MRKSQIFDSSDTCPIVWSCFKILVFYSKHLTLWYFSLEEIDSGYLRFWIYHWDMPLEQTLEIIDVSLKKCFYLISHFIKSWVPFSLTASMFDLKKKKKRSHELIGHFSAQHAERETEIHSEHGQIILTISVNTESAHVGHCWQATVTTMNKSVGGLAYRSNLPYSYVNTISCSYVAHACSELNQFYFSSLSCFMKLTKIQYRIMCLQWLNRRKRPSILYSSFIGSSSIHGSPVTLRAKVDVFSRPHELYTY